VERLAEPGRRDLTAVAALALVGLVIGLVPAPEPARVAAVLPLLLFLPGYALAAALLGPGEVPAGLRLVLGFALSVGVLVLGSVLVQLVVRLDRPVWAALLALATVLAAVVAWRRRDAAPATTRARRLGIPRFAVASLVAIPCAIAGAGWAIATATDGAHRQLDAARFSSLSVVPDGESGTPSPVTIGVLNHEGSPTAYTVTVRRGSRTVRRWRIELGQGEEWQGRLGGAAIAGSGPVIARLDRGGRPYHRVVLRIGGGG
jgi:uncharacterized membrane protein